MTQGSRTRMSRAARLGLGLYLGWLAGCAHPEKKTTQPVRQVGPPVVGAGATGMSTGPNGQPLGSLSSTGTSTTRTPGLPGIMTPSTNPSVQPAANYPSPYQTPQPASSFAPTAPGSSFRGQSDMPSRFETGSIGVSPRPGNSSTMSLQSGAAPVPGVTAQSSANYGSMGQTATDARMVVAAPGTGMSGAQTVSTVPKGLPQFDYGIVPPSAPAVGSAPGVQPVSQVMPPIAPEGGPAMSPRN